MASKAEQGAFVFFSYARQDKILRDRLEDHLSNLKYRGLITTWHDQEILAGEHQMQQFDIQMNKAHIVLLLISSHFMSSDYYYGVEMQKALERQKRGEVDVIPILLRPVLFTDAPFSTLQPLPSNGKPVVRWRDRDSAFVNIAYGIEHVARKYLATASTGSDELMSDDNEFPGRAKGLEAEIDEFLGDVDDDQLLDEQSMQEAREAAIGRRYYEEALEAYELALLRNPLDEDALRGLGNAFYGLERYQEAYGAFLEATQHNPTAAAYAGLGSALFKLQRYSEAVTAYETALKRDPAVTFHYQDFIQSLLILGKIHEAEQVRAKIKLLDYDDEE